MLSNTKNKKKCIKVNQLQEFQVDTYYFCSKKVQISNI